MEIPIFKCRASACGKIMTEPKNKSNYEKWIEAKEELEKLKVRHDSFKNQECKSAVQIKNEKIPKIEKLISELFLVKDKKELSLTCKSYLKEWIISKKYNRQKEFTSKQTEKGILTEEIGIDLIQDVLFNNSSLLIKNTQVHEDDYFTGEHDIEVLNFIIDNKSSYDIWTFPHLDEKIETDLYDYQGRVYLRLRNKEVFLLCYTLNDMPMEILQDEFQRYKYKNSIIDETDQEYYEFAKNYIYTNDGLETMKMYLFSNADTSDFVEVPKEKRIKNFEIERDIEIENKMIARVLECRNWINKNWDKF